MARVPIYWMELMDNNGRMKAGAFKQLDGLVKECEQRNLYVIIDLYGAPGGVDAKWQKFTTPYFKTNKELIDVVSRNSQIPPNAGNKR